MKFPRVNAHFARAFFCLVAVLALASASVVTATVVGDKDWMPLDPAHIALKEPTVEKDADAEALFWQVKVADELDGGTPRTVLTHYVRIKIFTERGRESQGRVDIHFGKVGRTNIQIKDIAGRTIKSDGTMVELKKEDIFERTIVKASGVKVKAKSFVMPSVEPGAIIEYRWREVRGDAIAHYLQLDFQRDIPVQIVKYHIKPFTGQYFDYGMRAQFFNGQLTPFQKEKDGFYSTTLKNVPAFREEPRMPPEGVVRPWMLVYYTLETNLTPDKFFKEYGKRLHEATKPLLKVNDDIRNASTEIIGGAQTPAQKLEKLFDYCRFKIKRSHDDASGMTADELKKLKDNKSPADTLKRGIGSDRDIDTLFGALALAAGFEVRVANLADRSEAFFDKGFPDDYFLNMYAIAVRLDNNWRFFSPSSTYVPFGMLPWNIEGGEALVTDPKDPTFSIVPVSAPEKSVEKRSAKLKLSDDGTLEGDVRIEYHGHSGADIKELNDDESPAEREERLKNMFKARMSTAEISDIKIENTTDPVKPFTYAFHVRVPGYGQRTGKRLFFQPAFFQHGIEPLFKTSGRKHDIYFHYPWAEDDSVEIELPDGFTLDNAEAPAPFNGGATSDYNARIQVTKDGRKLIYLRKFHFGAGNEAGLLFNTAIYPNLKTFFDMLHKQDNHTLSIKEGAAGVKTAAQ